MIGRFFQGVWRPLSAWTFGLLAAALLAATVFAPWLGLPRPDWEGLAAGITATIGVLTMWIQRGREKILGAGNPPASPPAPITPPAPTISPPAANPPEAPAAAVEPPGEGAHPPPLPPPVQTLPPIGPIDLPARRDIRGRSTDLEELHPEFRVRLERVLMRCADEGLPFALFEGYRSPARQSELYAQGRTKGGPRVTNARAGESLHQYGLAADIVLRIDGAWSWSTDGQHRGLWSRLHAIAADEGLEPLSFELPHLQLAGWTWQRAAAAVKTPAAG